MDNQIPKIRIKDIAKLAGVSEGTVDRVIHKRGEVSDKSRKSVEEALTVLNYTPNVIARSLATKKQILFIALIPKHGINDYWEYIERGFLNAQKEFGIYNVNIHIQYFDQFNSLSFNIESNKILTLKANAVIIAPIFKKETLLFSMELDNLAIPYSFVDNTIDEANFFTYYGQNSYKSGYIGARLLLNSLPDNSTILIARTHRTGVSVSNQTSTRLDGFKQYIAEQKDRTYKLINLELFEDEEYENQIKIEQSLRENIGVKAAITFNSKVYRLAKYFDNLKIKDIKLLGYDLLEENINCLKQGKISYLIGQRPEKQAYLTIRDICKKQIFGEEVGRINFVPIDILMKDNIDDYLNFER